MTKNIGVQHAEAVQLADWVSVFIDNVSNQVSQSRHTTARAPAVVFAHTAYTDARELVTQTDKTLIRFVHVPHWSANNVTVRPLGD